VTNTLAFYNMELIKTAKSIKVQAELAAFSNGMPLRFSGSSIAETVMITHNVCIEIGQLFLNVKKTRRHSGVRLARTK
jgi:hypothetical protein